MFVSTFVCFVGELRGLALADSPNCNFTALLSTVCSRLEDGVACPIGESNEGLNEGVLTGVTFVEESSLN